MADYAHVSAGEAELRAHFVALLVRVEAQNHDRAFALGKRLQATGQPVGIERQRLRRLKSLRRVTPNFEQCFPPPSPAPYLQNHHARGAEDERGDALGFAYLSGTQ